MLMNEMHGNTLGCYSCRSPALGGPGLGVHKVRKLTSLASDIFADLSNFLLLKGRMPVAAAHVHVGTHTWETTIGCHQK